MDWKDEAIVMGDNKAMSRGELRRPRRWRWALGLGAVSVLSALWWHWDTPLWVPFRLDPVAASPPYLVELGRGSGWHGLDTVRVVQDGTVVLHRLRKEQEPGVIKHFWETAAMRLPPDGLADVAAAVNDTRVLGLQREYHKPGVADGTQWVLRVNQGVNGTAVYCNNRFPRAIERFSERLDVILAAHGLAAVGWQRAPDGLGRLHERELWEGIKRR